MKNVLTKDSLVFKLVMLLPCWVPIGIVAVRVGANTTDYFKVRWYL